MTVDNSFFAFSIPTLAVGLGVLIKVLLLGMFGFYFIFSLVVVRQVKLMTEVLLSGGAPLLRAFSIIHAGFALGVLVLFIGLLFG